MFCITVIGVYRRRLNKATVSMSLVREGDFKVGDFNIHDIIFQRVHGSGIEIGNDDERHCRI